MTPIKKIVGLLYNDLLGCDKGKRENENKQVKKEEK